MLSDILLLEETCFSSPWTRKMLETELMGKVLTDAYGRTLYFFSRDAKGASLCTGGCLNNWPIFNVEGAYRSVFTDYNVTFYPVIYKICPDKVVEQVYTSTTEAQLYQKVQACQAFSIQEEVKTWDIYFDMHSRNVIIDSSEDIESISIINLQGQLIKTIHYFSIPKPLESLLF